MPIIHPGDATTFPAHGSVFSSFVSPRRGSEQLCAWKLTVAAGQVGVAHRPSNEEVLLILEGRLQVTITGERGHVGPGDVVVIPAGAEVKIDGTAVDASAWVTTTSGLQATLANGETIAPPWAQ